MSKPAKVIQFNIATVKLLPTEVAMRLNQHGTALGWWQNIDYWRRQGRTPQETAKLLTRFALATVEKEETLCGG